MVSGDELSAVLCPGWGSAVIKGSGSGSTPFVFTLGSVDFQFDSPSGATNGILSVSAGLSAAASGDFSSPAGQECGAVGFTYYLPAPPSVDCGGGAPPSCPLGCTSACSHFGCTPCAPKMPSVSYAAQGSSDCTGNTQTPVGSWHLTLTSVTMDDGGPASGPSYYTPHGTFTATMVLGGDGGTETADVSASF
jgi:hypothetical protein